MTARRLWVSLALVALLAAALGGYYWIHKPVTPAQAAVLASALADGGVAALLTLLGGGVGRRCLRGLAPEGGAPGERAAVEVALGWGLVGLTTLGLGFARLYYPVVIWVGVGLAFLISWRDARDWAFDAISPLRLFWVPGWLSRFAGLFVWLMLGLGLLRALTPPLMWDALMYHLTLPKLYAQAHQIHIDTDIVFTTVPQLPDMLYTAAFLMRGAIAAQTLGWAFGAALALGLASHAGELLGEGLGGLAPAVLFSSLTIAASLAWAYSELLMMLMALGGLIALRRWSQENDRRWLWLSGLFAGLAVGCKYNAFIVPVAGAFVIALTHLHPSTHSTLRRFILHPLSFILFAFLAFVPWLLKSWLETGHPISALLVPSGPDGALRHWLFNRPDLAERNPLWAALIFFRVVFLGVQGGSLYDAT
ncbi:MAG: hypothetical protein ACRDH2_16620, partial [Anaerolineales bacterium]